MKRFISFIRKMGIRDWLQITAEGLFMWAMMTGLLMYLLRADFSTAPVFVYNQF